MFRGKSGDQINQEFIRDTKYKFLVMFVFYVFGLLIFALFDDASANDMKSWLRYELFFDPVFNFIEARTPAVAEPNLASLIVFYLFLISPVNFYLSFKIGWSILKEDIEWIALGRSRFANYAWIISFALFGLIVIWVYFFLFYAESPRCSDCIKNNMWWMYTSGYFGMYGAGGFAGMAAVYFECMQNIED